MSTHFPHVRDRILEHLKANPGASTRHVARWMGADDSTADYHLRRLRKAGLASADRRGRELCWYASGCGLCPLLRRAMPALRRPGVLALAESLDDWPATARTLAARAGIHAGAARWGGALLVEAGLAVRTPSGRILRAPGTEGCLARLRKGERCDPRGGCSASQRAAGARRDMRPILSR